jgi:bifunctional DNase/RNase
MIKMTVEGIGIDPQNNTLVLLRDEEHKVFVPIYIGPTEAMSIQMELDSRQPPRPMTHDLMADILRKMDVQLLKVTVNDVDQLLYYATLHIQGKDEQAPQEIDARPSDAIALALRTQCGIYVSDQVIDKSGIQVDDVTEVSHEAGDLPLLSVQDEQPITEVSPDEMDRFSKLLEGVDLSGKSGESQSN